MKRGEAIERMIQASRRLRHSLHTERDYASIINRFLTWCNAQGSSLPALNEGRVTAYLSAHAGGWAVSTQQQSLCALVCFFQEALAKPLGRLPEWTKAQRPRRLPEWFTNAEALRVLSFLRDQDYLACALMYGSGLRRREVVSLRLSNFNLAEGSITVRAGKGDKDRVTCLPVALRDEITLQIQRATAVHAQDRLTHQPAIFVPPDVERKYPNAGLELRNFWFFPAKGLSRDPRSGIVRRHHIHEDSLAKQLRPAARRAGILRKVNCHAFRHSFATQFLLNGGTIHELKELLGHASIQTTEVYLHCLPRLGARILSPLDARRQDAEKIIHLAANVHARAEATGNAKTR